MYPPLGRISPHRGHSDGVGRIARFRAGLEPSRPTDVNADLRKLRCTPRDLDSFALRVPYARVCSLFTLYVRSTSLLSVRMLLGVSLLSSVCSRRSYLAFACFLF